MKKLALCFPTFNRAEKAVKQIEFMLGELVTLNEPYDVELIISDNSSSDENREHLKNYIDSISGLDFVLKYNFNINNLGLIGNLKKISTLCASEYIWFIGDDDTLSRGVLAAVISACEHNKGMIFINHRAVNSHGDVVMEQAFDSKIHHDLYDVFNFSNTTMMFITACVYRAEIVQEIFSQENNRLSLPFFASFKCAESAGVAFIDEVYIDNFWGETSWSARTFDVFYKQVPVDLLRSVAFSNNKFKAINVTLNYIVMKYVKLMKAFLTSKINKVLKNER